MARDDGIGRRTGSYSASNIRSQRPRYSGSKIAAFELSQIGGEIFIEDIDQHPYTVINYVRFLQ